MPAIRQLRESYPRLWLAWRFLILDLFQVVSMFFFASYIVLWLFDAPGIKVSAVTAVLFGCSAVSYVGLLIDPATRWVRYSAVALPVLAAGSRALSVLTSTPLQPSGVIVWSLLAFIYAWAGPRLMPPPLSNGSRKRWLRDAGAGSG